MSKKLVTSYTFTAASKTILSADFTSLEKIQLITNVTRNIIIYNFASPTLGGTLSGTTLTLTYNTAAAMADADKLQIFVEDAAAAVPVTAASLPLPALAATSTKQSDGTQKTQVVDGSGNVVSATANAMDVNIKSGSPTSAVSTNNSSTATLTSGSVFTGTGEDVTAYSEMRVSVTSNVASATDGLSLQQSTDNTNWDIIDTYTVAAATGKTFVIPRQAKYFRAVYTNGGTNQASFRLQTILNRQGTAPSSQRPGDAYTNETDLAQSQSFLMAYNGTTWDRVRTVGTGVLSASAVLTAGSAAIGSLTAGTAVIGKVGIDQTTPGTTNLVALAANQSVNVAQMNGVTVTMGNGVAGTGVQRVTMASDSTANIATIGTSVTPGTAAANLGKAEDAVHASGDTGVMNLAVANEALSSISGTDGDYTPHGVDRKGRLFVVQKANTSTLSNVASSATSVTLLASNTARISATIYNDSTQVCYVKFGATASATSFTVPLATNTYYEVPGGYTGIIDGIWVSANGNARVTELT